MAMEPCVPFAGYAHPHNI